MGVRLEKVIVDLDDRFTGPAARIAGAAALINRELDGMSRSGKQTRTDLDPLADRTLPKLGNTAGGTSRQIDRLSGRLRILLDVAAILGPGLVPIGAVGIPAVTGLAAAMGFAAVAGGVMISSLVGVGDALKAMNEAHLEPTVENLTEARLAMEKLSPGAQQLVLELRSLTDEWRRLQAAGDAVPAGMANALDTLETRLPAIERILGTVGDTVGQMLEDGAESLASSRWDDFFTFLATDAPPALRLMGDSLGNIAHAMGELWQAFDPLNDDFLVWLADATAGLDEWSEGLSQTEGFQEFVEYVRENGPQVADTLGSVGMAFIRIAEAAAPLGGPVLHVLELVADAISEIADSDAGPTIMATVTALALLTRAQAAYAAVARTSWGTAVKGADTFAGKLAASRGQLLKGAGLIAGIGVAASGAADGIGLSNAAAGALMGTIGGPWGAAIGGAIGLALDFAASQDKTSVSASDLTGTLDAQTGAITQNTRAYVAQRLEADGVLRTAQDLGVSLADVTSAALGDADAQDRVTASLRAQEDALKATGAGTSAGIVAVDEFRGKADDLTGAIGASSTELDKAQGAANRTADAVGGLGGEMDAGATSAERFARSLAKVNAELDERATARDYQQAVDDATAALKENGRTLDIHTQKGRDNQAALDAIASTANKVAENLRGTNRVEALRQARRDFVDTAVKMGMAEGKARDLARELIVINGINVDPKINANTAPAMSNIAALEARLRAIKDETVFVNVRQIGRTPGGDFGPTGSADGSTVPKTGRGYADRHLYLLADGEEVVSNRRGQADRFRPWLKAINRMADGGTAGDLFSYIDPRDKAPGRPDRGKNQGLKSWEKELAEYHRDLAEFKRDEIKQMREIHKAVRQVVKALTVDLSGGYRAVRDTLHQFKRDLHEAGGAWTKGLERQTRKIEHASERYDRLTGKIEAQQVAVDAANAALESIRSEQASFASAVTGQFRGNLFGSGLAGLDRTLTGDIGNRRAKDQLLAQLAGMGLDPTSAFYRELAAEGDVNTLQQLAAGGPGAVSHYAGQYALRDQLNAQAGQTQADLSYGADVHAAAVEAAAQTLIQQGLLDQQREAQRDVNKRLEKLEKATAVDGPDRTAKGVGDEINGTFQHGWTRGRNR